MAKKGRRSRKMVRIEFKGRETNQINNKETKLSQNRKRNADPEK